MNRKQRRQNKFKKIKPIINTETKKTESTDISVTGTIIGTVVEGVIDLSVSKIVDSIF